MGEPTQEKLIIKAEFPKKENEPNIEAAGVEDLMKYLQDFKVIIKRDLIDENIPIIVNNLEKLRSTAPAEQPAAEEVEEGGEDEDEVDDGGEKEVEEGGGDLKNALNLIRDVLMEYGKTKDKVIEIKDALDNLHDKIKGGNFELGVSEDDENEYGIDKNVFSAIKNNNTDEVSFSDSNIKIKISYGEGTQPAQNIARYFYKEKKGKLEEYLHFIYYFVNIMKHLIPPPAPAPAPAPAAARGGGAVKDVGVRRKRTPVRRRR